MKVNITRYSRRPGTPAAALKDLPERIRKDRSRALLAEADRIYDRYNERWMGRETSIVTTEKNAPGSTVCRNPVTSTSSSKRISRSGSQGGL